VEPQIRYSAAKATITSVFFGAAMRDDNVAFDTQSNRATLKRSGGTRACCRTASIFRPWTNGAKEVRWQYARALYGLRLKRNRYSSNRIMAPTIDMIQPAT